MAHASAEWDDGGRTEAKPKQSLEQKLLDDARHE